MNEREYNIPLVDIIPRREFKKDGDVNSMSAIPNVKWDFLTLYNQGGTVLARSKGHATNVPITLLYRGINFIALPDGTVTMEWSSFVNFVTTTD